MAKREIGKSGLKIEPLVLGGNVFGWTTDQSASFQVLDAFVAAGFNCIDTADVYSRWKPGNAGGESETIIGNWFKRSGRRADVIVATKVGMEMGPGKKGLSRTRILAAAEESLRRLQTDYIDLYQSHADDAATPLEETLDAYAQLIRQGKVRAIGASNYSAERLSQALETSAKFGHPCYQCLQPWYNLYDRDKYEPQLEPLCREARLGVICYYSLASGFLTGKYRSETDLAKSPRGGKVRDYLNDRGLRILKSLDEVAAKHGARPASVALAWLIARPSITAPIASATSVSQVQELAAATRLRLDADSIEQLNRASA